MKKDFIFAPIIQVEKQEIAKLNFEEKRNMFQKCFGI